MLLLAVVPVVVILIYVYFKDQVNREPFGLLLLSFVMGVLSCFPASLMESMLEVSSPSGILLAPLYTGFVEAGLCEELCKLAVLWIVTWRSRHFDEYFDGIVYAVYVSMGFACLENVLYVFSGTSFGESIQTAAMRAILSIPAHFLFAVAMGYYYSLARFTPRGRGSNFLKAFAVPWLLHGTFDAILLGVQELSGNGVGFQTVQIVLFCLFVWFDIRLWKTGMRRIQTLQELSRQQGFDSQDPFRNFTWKF